MFLQFSPVGGGRLKWLHLKSPKGDMGVMNNLEASYDFNLEI